MNEYPKEVKAVDVAGSIFGRNLFVLPGGRAKYDEVYIADGGNALYLVRVEGTKEGLKVTRRWIDWILRLFNSMIQWKDNYGND